LKYLFDNNISPKLAYMLAALDVDVHAVRDVLRADAPDEEIFAHLRENPHVWVSGDRRQLTRPAQAALLKAAKITALYFGPFWPKLIGWNQPVWMIRHWPLIDNLVRSTTKGTIAEIKQNGRSQILGL
jgi:PIN like domain